MVQESLSGEPPVAMDEAQARKYFGSGKRQAYFKRYKVPWATSPACRYTGPAFVGTVVKLSPSFGTQACGLKSYDKPRQSMTYTQVLRAEAVPFGTTTLSDEADEPPDKRAPSSAGAANVETLSSKDKMAAPRAQKEARESGVMASRRVSASVGILSQLEEQVSIISTGPDGGTTKGWPVTLFKRYGRDASNLPWWHPKERVCVPCLCAENVALASTRPPRGDGQSTTQPAAPGHWAGLLRGSCQGLPR